MCPLSVAALKGHKDIVIHLIEEKCANIDFKINVSKVNEVIVKKNKF
jgi:hypothetical protein